MPHQLMLPVVSLRIAAIQLAHAEGESGLRSFEEEMIVIVHQAVGMAAPPIAIDHIREEREKLRAVSIIADDVLAGIAPTGDMIDGSGKLDAERTCHGARVYPSQCAIARPDPISYAVALW
jgi:hypothetical protein